MTSDTLPIQRIDKLVSDTLSVIDRIDAMPHSNHDLMQSYRSACAVIPERIRSDRLRVAVVGVIKSGKSTFINALVEKELVKRGAGVVTAITTRIRKGKKNRAVIHLKSWDEINRILDKTLELFPDEKPAPRFDIRRQKDRDYLASVYEALEKEFPVTREGIRPETLIIRNALEGYAHCRDIIQADETEISFDGKQFDQHKIFTADPAKAFYVRDVCLEVWGKTIAPDIEIADCQGADSTDPAQLAQIISYLEQANLIVYCISSRTGLRQSDMAFLKTIARLGLMENLLFVNNCDLTEHENLEDLQAIESRIRKELKLLTAEPRLFAFSALFNLFESLKGLTERNRARLALWRADRAMVDYSRQNTQAFFEIYTRLLAHHQHQLLFATHLERLRLTTQALDQNCKLALDLLTADIEEQGRAKEQLGEIEENAGRLKTIVDNSIQGAVSGLTQEIESNLRDAFLKDSININRQVADFIRAAKLDVSPYRAQVKETGFKQILYLMFQDFKRQLDRFALEEVVPALKTLVRDQEKRIQDYFQALLDSYQIDFLTIHSRMGEDAQTFSLKLLDKDPGGDREIDIDGIKKILGLKMPNQVFSARFSTKMRANALTDLGFHSLVLFISALVDKHVRFSFTPGFDKAAAKIKKESLVMVRQQIKDFHLDLRENYFSPLIEAATRDFKEKILQRFSLYDSLNQDVDRIFELKQEERTQHQEKIRQARQALAAIQKELAQISLDRP